MVLRCSGLPLPTALNHAAFVPLRTTLATTAG